MSLLCVSLLAYATYAAKELNDKNLVGPITITEDGVPTTYYVMSTYPPSIQLSETAVSLPHNSGVQIAKWDNATYDPNMFAQFKLKDKTVSFTANISTVGCSCNAAFYTVTMPGIGSDGKPQPGNDGSYYCDANHVNNEWCWEMDILESNKYTMAVTPHKCDQNPGGATYSCDGGGCGTNAHNVNGQGMCPGGGCTINTDQPFRYSIHFGNTYHVTLTQGNSKFEFDSCNDSGYLQRFDAALENGMVFVMSHWGTDYNTMKWLDDMTGCGGDCDTSGHFIFSDISISS